MPKQRNAGWKWRLCHFRCYTFHSDTKNIISGATADQRVRGNPQYVKPDPRNGPMHEGSTNAQADGSMPRPFPGTTVRAVVLDIGAKFSEAGLHLRVLSNNPCTSLPLVHPCSWLASLLTSNATRRTSLCRPAILCLEEKHTLSRTPRYGSERLEYASTGVRPG